ncbi:hypothetical protein GBA52_028393 [Prunus armeniaca]|nr:hypothetical protein GBA52_028393 [Prunus armeniaca]
MLALRGLIHCCDHTEIKETLASAIDQMERVQLHLMAWSNHLLPIVKAVSRHYDTPPPSGSCPQNMVIIL